MVLVENASKSSPTPSVPTAAKKTVQRKAPNKDVTNNPVAKRAKTDDKHVSRLGKLPGLSISRAGLTKNKKDLTRPVKSSMDDLSKQLQTELRKSKEGVMKSSAPSVTGNKIKKPQAPRSSSKSSTESTTTVSRSSNESSNILLASTLPVPPKPLETPAKPCPPAKSSAPSPSSTKSSAPYPSATKVTTPSSSSTAQDHDSPAMQRKRLLEMIAQEKAEEERRRRVKRMREEPKKNRSRNSNNPVNKPPSATASTKPSVAEKPKQIHVSSRADTVKQEPREVSQEVQRSSTSRKDAVPIRTHVSVHPRPQPDGSSTIKVERVDCSQIITSVTPTPLVASTPAFNITPEQTEVLCRQFNIKDYLSRREMRALASQTGLTDSQVRDWFKQKRIDEDVPTIVSERPAEYQLNNFQPFRLKEEPTDVNDYGFEDFSDAVTLNEASETAPVKLEPFDEGPDSAVLDPTTGQLVKQRSIDKDMETILSKAPLLESLAKKMEKVNTASSSVQESLKTKVGDIIEVLDDDIVITQENIVNPGPKERPMSKILNKFLSQVEELEKTISNDQDPSNFNLMREVKRKDENLEEMSSECERQSSEISHLEQELRDKNDEIESILLNSVSKETFVRTQFQNLTTEVRQLRKENVEKKSLEERVKELEKQLRNKSYETEDWKEKHEKTLINMKELEETSTNMIGEITRGVGEKLAIAKNREKDMRLIEEKNLLLVEEVSKLEKQLIQLNNDHYKAREELGNQLQTRDTTLKTKDEEIEKLRAQVANLTKRFKDKVKEIQETLSKYNETLKGKNAEISEKSNEVEKMKQVESTQAKLITMLKSSIEKLTKENETNLMTTEEMTLKLDFQEKEIEILKNQIEEISKEEKTNTCTSKEKVEKTKSKSPKNVMKPPSPPKRKLHCDKVSSSTKKLKLEINKDVLKDPLLLSPLVMLRLPVFEMMKPPSTYIAPTTQENLSDSNYPVVLYSRNTLLDQLLTILY